MMHCTECGRFMKAVYSRYQLNDGKDTVTYPTIISYTCSCGKKINICQMDDSLSVSDAIQAGLCWSCDNVDEYSQCRLKTGYDGYKIPCTIAGIIVNCGICTENCKGIHEDSKDKVKLIKGDN